MKTVVFKFPSGFWGVSYRTKSGDWILYSAACRNKAEAIHQARTAAECSPSGRLYKRAEARP